MFVFFKGLYICDKRYNDKKQFLSNWASENMRECNDEDIVNETKEFFKV